MVKYKKSKARRIASAGSGQSITEDLRPSFITLGRLRESRLVETQLHGAAFLAAHSSVSEPVARGQGGNFKLESALLQPRGIPQDPVRGKRARFARP